MIICVQIFRIYRQYSCVIVYGTILQKLSLIEGTPRRLYMTFPATLSDCAKCVKINYFCDVQFISA